MLKKENSDLLAHSFLIVMSYLGFSLCLFFISLGLNQILASALTGFVGSFIPACKNKSPDGIIYAASFSAIGIFDTTNSYFAIWIIPLVVFLIYTLLQKRLIGYGGKLGTTAFISTGIVLGVLWSF